jgi:hypothetical protein
MKQPYQLHFLEHQTHKMLQVQHVSKAVDPETCSSGAPIKEDGASEVSLNHLATDPRETFQNLRMLMSFLLKDYF